MKERLLGAVIGAATLLSAIAADPGGTVGLAKATFTGSSFDATFDIWLTFQPLRGGRG